MDLSSKKRGLFGFTGLFRSSSAAPSDESNAKPDASNPSRTQPQLNSVSAPQSPMQRASEAQLASRKIISRPQGPSSKLSQSFSAYNSAPQPSSTAIATPKRMPGDNPNKPPPSLSASTALRPPPSHLRGTNFSGAASTPRNIFRSSALYPRPGVPSFSPQVAPNSLTQSFPPYTPGRTARGSSVDVNGRTPAHTTSSELFPMRIPSPPRNLTGEAMAKEVPEDPSRTRSIYADEFLAHYCPPEFDEQQRRQFFCILDLRRLKYAADEVFTKKDWKINIMNFAKEYEKSRSLIMLRYGLYEFKTVRASEAVKKEWKEKHGIADSDDEAENSRKANGGSKRKAEEELTPSGNALMASVSGGNKRARAPESTTNNKRKADAVGEPDENHPSKLQRPTPTPQKAPSATKSVFETIANSSTGMKPTAKGTLFSASTGPKPNGPLGKSVFEAASKPAAAASNIFGHLSDESKGSGNEGADEKSETSTNADGDESEAQDVSQSDEQAESGGVSTPQFVDTKKGPALNGTSSASSEAGESTQGRSIFERITRGSDGQPLRQLPSSQDAGALFSAPAVKSRSVSPVKEQAPAAPSDKTWNANTPIKFSAPATSIFGAASQKPAASSAVDFGASAAKKDDEAPAPAEAQKESAPQAMSGASTKEVQAAAPAPNTNIFSFPQKSADTSTSAAPIFGGLKPAASAGTSLFGASTPAFGQQSSKEEAKDGTAAPSAASSAASSAAPPAAPSAPASSLFGAKPSTSDAAPAPFQQSSVFGNQSKAEPASTTQSQPGSLFGNTQTSGGQTAKPAGIFGADPAKTASNIFGANSTSSSSGTEELAAKKFAFGGGESKSGPSLFGSATPGGVSESSKPAVTKSIFGAVATPAAPAKETQSLFGTNSAAPATETKPLFGATPAAPTQEGKSLFGATPAAPSTETKSLFGATSTPAVESKPLFGNTAASTEAKPLFGNATGSNETKPLFGNAGGAAEAKPTNLFGTQSTTQAAATPIFNFGSSQAPAASQPTTAQPSGSIFGTGGNASFTFSAGPSNGATINNPFAGGSGSYSAPSSFNFGSGDSQPAGASFTFGSGTPSFNFGDTSNTTAPSQTSGPIFTFGASQPSSGPSLTQNPPTASSIFGSTLAPGGGTSTGTNTPFTFGGASSLATTPAATTPEPSANAEDGQGTNADGDEAPQEQISLTEGGPGEEDESVVHEVRAKALKLVTGGESEDDSSSNADKDKASKKNPWKVQGVGPLRLLKNKTTGSVRLLLRAEPRGHIALNKMVLPEFTYKAEPSGGKYVKVTTAADNGKGLETWMIQVKTAAMAQALAENLEKHKMANEKK